MFATQKESLYLLKTTQSLTVIGGGAAGFFCAVNAARSNPSLKVVILERSNKVLSKVKVSGGGRCNVTHSCFEIDELIRKYPRGQNFLKKSFHWFNTKDTINWFEERGVKLKTEADGRMFPITNSSQTIIDCLLNEADKYDVEIRLQTDVKSIEKVENVFQLQTTNYKLQTNFLCIACGEVFQKLHNLIGCIFLNIPSRLPFHLYLHSIFQTIPLTQLMGVSVEQSTVKIAGTKLSEIGPLLITHWGMSGPAILRTSALGAEILAERNYKFTVIINWLQEYSEQTLRSQWQTLRGKFSSQKMHHKNPFNLPTRLWIYLLNASEIDESKTWSDINSKQQNKLIQNLTAQTF